MSDSNFFVDPVDSVDLVDEKVKDSVSVVIPTYNRRALVAEAIRSALGQTHPADEIIVVDDASTDGTAQSLEKAFGGRVVVLGHDSRKGVSAARNTGIRASRGEWIAFLDSDDRWLPQKLERQLDDAKNFPDVPLFHCEEIWFRRGVRVNPRKRHFKLDGWAFEQALPFCRISPSAALLRRSLIEEVGLFDESLPAAEDYDYWLRVLWKYPCRLLAEPLVVKTGGHLDQLSAHAGPLERFRIAALAKLIETAPLSRDQAFVAVKELRQKVHIYALGCRKRGRSDEAESIEHECARIANEITRSGRD
ncbi:MAG: glycosyltransferase [bacterium]